MTLGAGRRAIGVMRGLVLAHSQLCHDHGLSCLELPRSWGQVSKAWRYTRI